MRASERHPIARSAACGLLMLALFGSASSRADSVAEAQQARALARAQALLQQVGQERGALQARINVLERDTLELKAQLDRAQQALKDAASQADARAQQTLHADQAQQACELALTARDKDLAQSEHALAASNAQQQQAAQLADRLRQQRNLAEQALATLQQHNRGLYKTAQEILDRYRQRAGLKPHVLSHSPLGLGQVAAENEIQTLDRALYDDLGDSALDDALPRKAGAPP